MLEKYPALFGERTDGEGDDDRASHRGDGSFADDYGWLWAAKEVADFMNIKLSDVWDVNMLEVFNYRMYLKAKANFDRRQLKQHSTGL